MLRPQRRGAARPFSIKKLVIQNKAQAKPAKSISHEFHLFFLSKRICHFPMFAKQPTPTSKCSFTVLFSAGAVMCLSAPLEPRRAPLSSCQLTELLLVVGWGGVCGETALPLNLVEGGGGGLIHPSWSGLFSAQLAMTSKGKKKHIVLLPCFITFLQNLSQAFEPSLMMTESRLLKCFAHRVACGKL